MTPSKAKEIIKSFVDKSYRPGWGKFEDERFDKWATSDEAAALLSGEDDTLIETYKEHNDLLKRQVERLENILLRGLSESYRAGYFRLGFDKEKWIETNAAPSRTP